MATKSLPSVVAGAAGLSRYLEEIRKFPMLEPNEEYMLAKRWQEHEDSEAASALDLFFWLFLLLAVSGLALWPSTGRDQRAELRLERRGWADRIEFDGSKVAGGTAPPPDNPSQSSGAA